MQRVNGSFVGSVPPLIGAIGVVAIVGAAFCTSPGIQWNPPGFAPAYAIVAGLDIYLPAESGARLGWVYGPVFAYFSAPGAWVPNITLSFWASATLNFAAIALPAWMVMKSKAKDSPTSRRAVAFAADAPCCALNGVRFTVADDAVSRPYRGQEETLAIAREHQGRA